MSVASNTRVIAQAETRRLLKQSGREVLLERGYAAASVAAIAAHAGGFTTGALYSNFGSKADLTLEVLGDLQNEANAALGSILENADSNTTRVRLVMAWAEDVLQSGWPRLELEFALAHRDSPNTVSTEAGRSRTAVDNIANMVDQVLPQHMAVMPARRIAELILDVCFGIAVRRIVDPSVTVDHLFDLINELVSYGN
nr:TetR/AcrR family transcriptional regulator [Rhodococcus sp. (in: high G+C Gram-positive bacteria)]